MNHKCTITGKTFNFDKWEIQHLKKLSPIIGGKLYDIPVPSICSDERLRIRLAHRNEHNLYRRKCSKTGKEIISSHHPEASLVVYDLREWWDDGWSGLDYGKDIDFNKPFFEQFAELQKVVPRMAVLQSQNENSTYTNCVSNLKDCYLLFSSDFSRDCYYGIWTMNCNDCMDNYMINHCEKCFECVFSDKCYNCIFNVLCTQNRDSSFLFDCHGCNDCFMSYNLRNKKYCYYNEQLSKDEYEEKI